MATGRLAAQGEAALSGTVRSKAEGTMEGVVVTVRGTGANVAVSVVTDGAGRYLVPRTHMRPGEYAVTVRAVGYDLVDPGPVEVSAAKATALDLELQETKNLAAQLTSLEWVNSMPGSAEHKDQLVYQVVSCAYCHTYQRIVKSKHTAEEFVRVITRMQTYYPDGTAVSDDNRGRGQKNMPAAVASAETNPEWGFVPGVPKAELAQYLATVNLSGGKTTWPYELKTLPRPTGKATRVIITQWDLPRKDTVSHDLDMDSNGIAWYTDESRQFIGRLEPLTNTFTEYPLPAVPPGDLSGTRDIQVDREDNVWFPMRVAGGGTILAKFDPETETLTTVDGAGGQFMALGPDGKIWAGYTRVDPKTSTVDRTFSWNKAPNLPPGPHGGYTDHVVVNSKGNPYISDFHGSYIVGINVKTGQARFWPTPTRDAMPRRGRIDLQDRYWFGEYTGDRIGMFDTRTEAIQEWLVRKYSTPYTASTPDRNGHVYAPSNMSERLLRLDPETGEVIEYLMPTNFDTKKIIHDPTTSRVTLWMANTRNARLIRVEPLD
jgi:virginiamycin B lyase